MAMKSFGVAVLLLIALAGTGCAASLTGQVVDAQTGEPIRGAVVLGVWTRLAGWPGLHHHEFAGVRETQTDDHGRFVLERVGRPNFEGDESVTVYKFGYAAWNNLFVYPSWERRSTTSVPSQIALEPFPRNGSHQKHLGFIEIIGGAGLYGRDSLPMFWNAVQEEMKLR